jgi:uncharacterized protein (TIGR00251 family)
MKNALKRLKTESGDGWILIHVRVQPRSSSQGTAGLVDGALKVRLMAPPVEGQANRALRRFLSKSLHIPKGNVEIVAGEKARLKRVRLHGVTFDDLRESFPEIGCYS